ncbi:MAG: DUF1638 domain-containing protein [Lachnospiraceae bacterium]|nr:DUF1638 domain-containing protein [Lachnospiraceae bacterium]
MKNRVIIACRTLEREIQAAMKETGNSCLVYYLPLKYHVAPKEMAVELQRIIDSLTNVDEILICVSGCGGSTKELKASTSNLIIPKTRDCIDILLSNQTGKIDRDKKGIFFTDNWLEFFKESPMAFDKLVKEYGKEQAKEKFRQIYKGFEHFYIVDTGAYNVEEVKAHLKPLVDILDGELTVVKGRYEILRKMVAGKIDQDFRVIRK